MSRLDYCRYELVGNCYDWKNDNCDGCNIFKAYCEGARGAKKAQNNAIPTHGRLIDADALIEYCENQKSKTISNNDIARFPTISPERPHGEWIDKGDYAICSKCGGSSGTQFDGVERIPRITTFCPYCGVKMTKGGGSE